METTDAKRQKKPLIKSPNQMICPRCKEYRNILAYDVLERAEEYEDELNPIYKCPKRRGGCSYIFSPGEKPVYEWMLPTSEDSAT